MAVFELYSKRQSDAAKAGQADVYRYDVVTPAFRRQLLNIANSAFGDDKYYDRRVHSWVHNKKWAWVDKTYSHEKGIAPLGGKEHESVTVRKAYLSMLLDDALDMTELIGFQLHTMDEENNKVYGSRQDKPQPRMDEVNYRLREAGMGFQFEAGRLTRVDSQLIHQEVIKPALTLLSKPGFEGAQQEYLTAHAHYRSGQNKEAIAMAANALESTFKAIFDAKGWEYAKGPRISDLVKVAKGHSLWPDYLDNSFDQLVSTLQNGLPKIRDNDASHGQGATPKAVPDYITAYALHLAASKIVFIVSAADG